MCLVKREDLCFIISTFGVPSNGWGGEGEWKYRGVCSGNIKSFNSPSSCKFTDRRINHNDDHTSAFLLPSRSFCLQLLHNLCWFAFPDFVLFVVHTARKWFSSQPFRPHHKIDTNLMALNRTFRKVIFDDACDYVNNVELRICRHWTVINVDGKNGQKGITTWIGEIKSSPSYDYDYRLWGFCSTLGYRSFSNDLWLSFVSETMCAMPPQQLNTFSNVCSRQEINSIYW